ncbi:MAG: hypothetical protein ACM674_06665, partial [Bacteroidales bacterium]
MPSHIYIYVCDVFCVLYVFFVLCLIPKVLQRSIMALSWTRVGGYLYFSHGKSLKKFCYCPVGHKNSRPSAPRQNSTFARQRAQTVMSAARERKIARFFLHAATRWHSACYV